MKPSRPEAIKAAGRALAVARAEFDARTPREAAEAAWYQGHELSVEAIEAHIIRLREQALAAREAQQSQPLAA